MHLIDLENNKKLGFEVFDKKIRLIALENEFEIACRKSTYKNLITFLDARETCLFNGRLQLHKVDKDIMISVKQTSFGSLSILNFKKLLTELS